MLTINLVYKYYIYIYYILRRYIYIYISIYLTYRSLNYGSIGISIAHEIMHALGPKGRTYNRHGVSSKWWTKASIVEYDKRAECIRKQFSRFTVYDINVSTTERMITLNYCPGNNCFEIIF